MESKDNIGKEVRTKIDFNTHECVGIPPGCEYVMSEEDKVQNELVTRASDKLFNARREQERIELLETIEELNAIIKQQIEGINHLHQTCLLYTSPSPRD